MEEHEGFLPVKAEAVLHVAAGHKMSCIHLASPCISVKQALTFSGGKEANPNIFGLSFKS